MLAKEIDFEIGHFHNFWISVTLTLDRVIQHVIVYHSSSYVDIINFVEIRKRFVDRQTCGWTFRPDLSAGLKRSQPDRGQRNTQPVTLSDIHLH